MISQSVKGPPKNSGAWQSLEDGRYLWHPQTNPNERWFHYGTQKPIDIHLLKVGTKLYWLDHPEYGFMVALNALDLREFTLMGRWLERTDEGEAEAPHP